MADDRNQLTDMLDAEGVEVVVDAAGKLRVNVDGVCVLRIGKCKHVTFEDPIRAFDNVYEEKE